MQNLKSPKKYIEQQSVLVIATGIVIGLAIKDFAESFISAFIAPVLDKIMDGTRGLQNNILDIGGIRFGVGLFINATINLAAMAFIVIIMARIFNAAVKENRERQLNKNGSSKNLSKKNSLKSSKQ